MWAGAEILLQDSCNSDMVDRGSYYHPRSDETGESNGQREWGRERTMWGEMLDWSFGRGKQPIQGNKYSDLTLLLSSFLQVSSMTPSNQKPEGSLIKSQVVMLPRYTTAWRMVRSGSGGVNILHKMFLYVTLGSHRTSFHSPSIGWNPVIWPHVTTKKFRKYGPAGA